MLALSAARGEAQSPGLQFGHLTVEDELSNSWVRAVVRDSRGFLWVGTQDCLNRYDGNGFRHYCGDPGDNHGLAASAVTAMFEDSQKRLWVGASLLHLYDRELDRFDRFALDGAGQAPAQAPIRAIVEDRQGRVWVGTENGLFRVDPATRAVQRFQHESQDATSLNHSGVKDLLVDRQGRLWVATVAGIARLAEGGDGFVRLFQGTMEPPILRDDFEALYQDESGVLWLGGYVLVRLDPVTGRTRIVPHSDPGSYGGVRILELHGDGKGHLLIGTENAGLVTMDLATEKLHRYLPDPADATSLGASSIWALTRDSQGILWIGTFNAGLDFASPLGQRFGLVRARRDGLSSPHVSAVIEDHVGRLWIGTDGGGLNLLERAAGRFTHFRADPQRQAALASDAVLSLLEDSRRRLWVGTYGGGLQLVDRSSRRFRRFRLDDRLPPDGGLPPAGGDPRVWGDEVIWSIVEDGEDRLLLGSESGAQVLDQRTGRLSRLADAYPGLSRERTRAIVVDPRGNLWLGSGNRIEYLDRTSGSITRYSHGSGLPSVSGVLGPEAVAALYLDTRGNLWVGCAAGLSVLETGSRSLRRYRSSDGLPSDWIASVLEDGAGNLWLGTGRGLVRFEKAIHLPQEPHFQIFDADDGVQGLEFRSGAAFRSRRGELFFGGQRGLSHFFPERIDQNPDPPPVALTELLIFGKPAAIGARGSPLAKAISETTELTLSHEQSVVAFEFAALNLLLPQKNRYAHRLEGVDEGWNEIGQQHVARYSGLRPGDYVFHVRAANNDGVWNEEGLRLRIRILPPLWGRWWFRAIAALALGAALVRTYRRRVATLRREEEMIRRHAYEDALTGLPNRRLFDDRLAQVIKRAARYKKTVGVMFLDLDGLKRINDTLGHVVGDALLRQSAERLVACLRVADTVARLGGDEFLLLLPEIGGIDDATRVAEKVIEALGRPYEIEGRQVRATASMGVALYPAHGSEGEALVRNADLALYRAKEHGRNRFRFFDPEAVPAVPRPTSPPPVAS